VQKLLRLCEQIVFCFDGDKPGQKAAWRALENALPQLQDGKRIGFLFLPEEHDPDTFIREYGHDAFEHEVENSLPLSGYLLRELTAQVDLRTQEGRSALLKHAQPLLTVITAPTTALLLRKEIAALAGVTQDELEALWSIKPVAAPRRQVPQKVKRAAPSAMRTLLRCLVMKPELARELPVNWQGEGAEGAAIHALCDWLNESADETSTAAMIQHFQGSMHEAVFAAAQGEVMQWGDEFDVAAEFAGSMQKLRRDAVAAELETLNAKMFNSAGGLDSLSKQEQARYLQLLQLGKV
jgi:DNA primase